MLDSLLTELARGRGIKSNSLLASLSDNAEGRLPAAHTQCAEGVFGEWTNKVLYL